MFKHIYLLLIFCWLCPTTIIYSQICTGNLGDNIFELGDFNEGIANIPEKPEGIISTYNYVFSGPPSDGNFTITNNTAVWVNLYSSWMKTGDNSDNPDGYFMVVNADYTPGIFYEQIIEGLCENTLYTFSADILNLVKTGTPDHTLPNVSFLLGDEEKYSTGDIGQTEKWNTYGFTFTTGEGVTSMKLSLRNNAPGGYGNDLAIDNVTFRPCGPVAEILPKDIANICEDGDPIEINATVNGNQYGEGAFQWQQSFDGGQTWENIEQATENTFEHTEKAAGFYYYHYLLANGSENLTNTKCRVNSNVKIIQVVPKFWDIERTICAGLSFEVGDASYDKTGVYTDSLISSIGCDSIVTLDLRVVDDEVIQPVILTTDPICAGMTGGAIDIPHIKNIHPPFQIQMGDKTVTSLVRFVELSAGTYEIFMEDAIGCTFDTVLQLIDPEPFKIDLGEDVWIDLGESVTINPSTNYPITQFQWSPIQEESCENDCFDATFLPTSSQIYYLKATSELGCEAIDSIFIAVKPTRKLYIPNVFSPNQDGRNDYFSIFPAIPNVAQIRQVAIYDRWGNLIFLRENIAPNDSQNLWNGFYRGKLVEQGIYLYTTKVLFLDGKEELLAGTVSVVY